MKLVIIESPYSGDIDANTTYARAALRDSILRGEAPIAFHLLYTQPGVLRDVEHYERALGMALADFWKDNADLVAFYTDRGWSRGMQMALEHVARRGIKYQYRALDGEIQEPDEPLRNLVTPRI